jgi:hypothetical protein
MGALSFSDGFFVGLLWIRTTLMPGRPEMSGESGVAMAEMDGIAVGAGNWRANSEITLRHPAAAGPQSSLAGSAVFPLVG